MKRHISKLTQKVAMAALAILLAGVLSGARANPVGQDNLDPLSKQVRHQLVMLPWYGVFDDLRFQVNGTQVILSGAVTSEHAVTKGDAAKAVEHIPGVTAVVNNIQILPISRFDDQIRRAEYRTIFSKADLGRYTLGAIPQVHIIVANGHVTLEGTVINQMDRTIAGLVANTVPGVFSVTNNLQVKG